jgi:hypothetical protein
MPDLEVVRTQAQAAALMPDPGVQCMWVPEEAHMPVPAVQLILVLAVRVTRVRVAQCMRVPEEAHMPVPAVQLILVLVEAALIRFANDPAAG